ncbi:MAG: ABC transporter permease [Bacteroides sp.]|nr:ABC transporter permease [Eubacterium sp.]MCM1417673.1 ABC transporter permease [Roseburia sp.]MCM1461861.1 ABC transporter permease [Bacteroides sp.]
MNGKHLMTALKKDRLSNLILFLFMTVSAAIAVTVALSLTRLFGSITAMYATAKPPHFLQMHKGDLDQAAIDEFNRDYGAVVYAQTVPMLNVYGSDLTVVKPSGETFSLADCRLDISLVKQNAEYDVLLGADRQRLAARDGEIGVPVILLDQYDISVGDTILLDRGDGRTAFTVFSTVCDGQMNSTLCSSTRFLIGDGDFDRLYAEGGETEYLIEAWFADSGEASAYQTAYEQSALDLPKNGQAITYSVIFLLSAMADLLMAIVFLLAGVLLIAVSMVCLRYVVLAELEDDMREIGTMKAIGVSSKGIRGLYLGKLRLLTAAGCVVGFPLAILFSSLLAEHMSRTFGSEALSAGGLFLGAAVCLIVYGAILLFSRRLFRRLDRVSVTELLVRESGFGKRRYARGGTGKLAFLPFDLRVGLYEARRGYGLIFGLLLTVTLLTAIPARIAQTLKSGDFAAYMGCPQCDLLLEVEQGDALEPRYDAAKELISAAIAEGAVANCDILRRVRLQARGGGELIGLHIDSGDRAGSALNYIEGREARTDGEIALSALIAEELGASVGDPLPLVVSGEERGLTVCGIYQDITSGGRTAKTTADFSGEAAEKYTFMIDFAEGVDVAAETARLRDALGSGYSVERMEEFVGQTLGGVTAQVDRATGAICPIGLFLVFLIALLFLKLRVARNAGVFAAKRAIGIPFSSIRRQELIPILAAGGLGVAVGIAFTEGFGAGLIGVIFALMNVGVSRIVFAGDPFLRYLALLAGFLILLTVAVFGVCQKLKKGRFTEALNE